MIFFDRTATNRLRKPTRLKEIFPGASDRHNWCGQDHAHDGDFVLVTGRGIGAGTVGRVLSVDYNYLEYMTSEGHELGQHYTMHTPATIETLDGAIQQHWLWYLTVIPASAVQEVKDFYAEQGRPQRIKVDW